ncbi:hypothetical protein [Escherichia coli]|nr:hypothetical protein [Escherichia coli]
MSFELNEQMVDSLAKQHRWAATGVSDYPPRDPLPAVVPASVS